MIIYIHVLVLGRHLIIYLYEESNSPQPEPNFYQQKSISCAILEAIYWNDQYWIYSLVERAPLQDTKNQWWLKQIVHPSIVFFALPKTVMFGGLCANDRLA